MYDYTRDTELNQQEVKATLKKSYAGIVPDYDNWTEDQIDDWYETQSIEFSKSKYNYILTSLSLGEGKDLDDLAIDSNCLLTVDNFSPVILSYPRWRDLLAVVASHVNDGAKDIMPTITTVKLQGEDPNTGLPHYRALTLN